MTLEEIIAKARFGRFQAAVVLLCGALALLDGFDISAASYVGPALMAGCHLPPRTLATLFNAGLFGLAVGVIAIGPLADRFGRKTMTLVSVLICGLFSLLCAGANSPVALIGLRFLAGLGMGGATPSLIALSTEYSPIRIRARIVAAMYAGIPIGAYCGGQVSEALIERFGWRAIFTIGGVAPLVLLPVYLQFLPESVQFLASKTRNDARIKVLLRRIDPSLRPELVIAAAARDSPLQKMGLNAVGAMLGSRWAAPTVLLWWMFFLDLLIMYFLMNWVPVLLVRAGPSEQAAIAVASQQYIGGIAGGLLLGYLMDKLNVHIVLAATFGVGMLALVLIAMLLHHPALLYGLLPVAGACSSGLQIGLIALAASIYPFELRVSGLSWAIGIGRLDAILGLSLAGVLLQTGKPPQDILTFAAIPMLFGVCGMLLLKFERSSTKLAPVLKLSAH